MANLLPLVTHQCLFVAGMMLPLATSLECFQQKGSINTA
jgi:hypothetical protein